MFHSYFNEYAFDDININLLTSSCTLHRRKFRTNVSVHICINIYKWANTEKCTKSVAGCTHYANIKLLYAFYCPHTEDLIVQFFKFAHL